MICAKEAELLGASLFSLYSTLKNYFFNAFIRFKFLRLAIFNLMV